jgi:hypothetical protein
MTDYLAKPFKGHELFGLIEGRRDPSVVSVLIEAPMTRERVDLEGFKSSMREAGAAARSAILDAFITQVPTRLATLEPRGGQRNTDATTGPPTLRGGVTIGAHQLAGLLQHVEAPHRRNIKQARGNLERAAGRSRYGVDYARRDRDAHVAPQAGLT